MKRKTNLFNLDETNSLFLTFSNYTEYLTGNFLSTNTKMYPSSFICLNLPLNDENSIKSFKKFLMCYYENKLTTLRTYFVESDQKSENRITPLLYLLDAIKKFFESDDFPYIKYVGDIVEQDYNGTYSDSICIVNLNSGYNITLSEDNNSDQFVSTETLESEETEEVEENTTNNEINIENPIIYTYDNNVLFGWKEYQIVNLYGENIAPIYDNNNDNKHQYFIDANINITTIEPKIKGTIDEEIIFNCVIPLFDIKNIKESKINDYELDFKNNNIPLGIWISPEPVKVSKISGFAQSWSLVIGSKFSPFPYASINTIDDNNSFDENTVKDIAYMTYSELLAKHSELQNQYYECLQVNNKLANELKEIKSNLNSLLIQTNYDKISELVENKISDLENKFNAKMKTIEEYIASLKWKYIN